MRILLLLTLILASCSSNNSASDILEKFVSYRFSKNQTLDKTRSMVSGPLLKMVDEMTEEEFSSFSDTTTLKFKKFKVIAQSCQELTCTITYEIKYSESEGESKEITAEIKKIAELVKEEETWKVSDVRNIKTYYKSKNPL